MSSELNHVDRSGQGAGQSERAEQGVRADQADQAERSESSGCCRPPARVVAAEGACQARAHAFLAELIGAEPADLVWDVDHHLQGHLHVGTREFVVIAARDDEHRPLVLPAPAWDAVRHSTAEERRRLLAAGAITDHDRLVAVLAADELASPSATPELAAA